MPKSRETATRTYIRNVLPYRTEDNRIDGVVVTFTEITERKRSEQEVQAAREFAESIVNTVREPLLVLTPDLRVRSANSSFYRTYHVNPEETIDRPIYELGNRQWDIPELRRLLEEILPTNKQFDDFEVERDFETIGRRTMLLNARRLEAVQLILLAIADVTERRRGERERELLSRELSHRVKNTLAVVQALAMQTDRSSSVEEYRGKFVGRLSALARAHSLLLDAQWRGADLKQLVEQALQPFAVDRPDVLEIEGEPVPLSPTKGLGLSLILHELATNAAKYGALARSEGRVHVSWQLERRRRPARPPALAGAGQYLMSRRRGSEASARG